eukprot:4991436-Lingulodinium_polyedra.AAC.1
MLPPEYPALASPPSQRGATGLPCPAPECGACLFSCFLVFFPWSPVAPRGSPWFPGNSRDCPRFPGVSYWHFGPA